MANFAQKAVQNVRDTVYTAIGYAGERALVIFDAKTSLNQLLVQAYREVVPQAVFADFDVTGPEHILSAFGHLPACSLVVLIQSSSFRLSDFRIRIELFQRGFKVIEHVHLDRIKPGQEEAYIDSLAYDADYYRKTGHALKHRLDRASGAEVRSGEKKLVFDGAFEAAKLNIGDYAGMQNVGGTFPIGEVFTELQDVRRLNGEATIFAYGGFDFCVRLPDPFTLVVKDGLVIGAPDAPQEFLGILDVIRTDEPAYVRELGLGLNRAFGKHRIVDDITAFERQCGVHLSLGAKHGVYKKPGMPAGKHAKYHIDVFVDATDVLIDGLSVFDGSRFHD